MDGPKNLIEALIKFQSEVPTIPKNKTGAHGAKYADLSDIINIITPILSKNSLCISHTLDGANIITHLYHVSGDFLTSVYPLYTTTKAQEFGSQITYARRYSLQAILGISAEVDDDGHAASQGGVRERLPRSTRHFKTEPGGHGTDRKPSPPRPSGISREEPGDVWPEPDFGPPGPGDIANPTDSHQQHDSNLQSNEPSLSNFRENSKIGMISEKQQKMFFAVTKKAGWSNEQVKLFLRHTLKIESSRDIPWTKFNILIRAIDLGKPLDEAIEQVKNEIGE